MTNRNILIKNFKRFAGSDVFIFGLATLAERLLSFSIIPLLTKTLTQDLYVAWTQIIAVLGLLSPIALIGLPTAVVRFVSGKEDIAGSGRFFYESLLVVIFNWLLISSFLYIFELKFTKLIFGDIHLIQYQRLISFALLGEVLYELITAFLRAEGKIRKISAYFFIKYSIRVSILAFVLLVLDLELYMTIALNIFMQIALVLFMYYKDIYSIFGFSLSKQSIDWYDVFRVALPLVPYATVTWANIFINRYFLLHFLSVEDLGSYSLSYSLAATVALIHSVLGYILYPRMAKLWNVGNQSGVADELRRFVGIFVFFAIFAISLITIVSPQLVRIVSTPDYLSGRIVFFSLGVSFYLFGLYSLHIIVVIISDTSSTSLLVSMLIALFVNVISSWLLIPLIGIPGAAISMVISNLFLAIWSIIYCKKVVSYRFPMKQHLSGLVAVVMLYSLVALINSFTSLSDLHTVGITLALAVLVFSISDLLSPNSVLLYNMRR